VWEKEEEIIYYPSTGKGSKYKRDLWKGLGEAYAIEATTANIEY
jgi:hypothetical protein